MKKSKKIIIITSFILIAIIIITAVILKRANKKYNSVSDFSSVRELVNYYGCEYIKTKNSDEKEYKKDIYMIFKVDPIEENGNTNKSFYETIISQIEAKMNNNNIRIIDESRNLIIRILYNSENKKASYTINNTTNYFENIKSAQSIDKYKEENISEIKIKSKELNSIINSDWSKKKASLGSKDSECDKYEIYFDEGYKIKTISSKVFNIIYTKQYKSEVLDNIRTAMTNDEIEKILGTPTYEDSDNNVIGYKNELLYAFFYDGEISIYRVEKFEEEKNSQFAKIVTTLNKTGDYKTFLNELTDIYPDYDTYYQSNSYVKITYPLRGFYVMFGASSNNGITLYKNYQGKVTEEISIDEIKNEKKLPANVYLEIDKNLVDEIEKRRTNNDYLRRNPDICDAKTNQYVVYQKEDKTGYQFYSRNKEYPDSEISGQDIINLKEETDTEFIYEIKNKEKYVYNAITMQTTKM